MTDTINERAPADPANPNAAAKGSDRRALDAIFRHPLAHNLSWRDVVDLFAAIGGAEEKHNGEFLFQAGDQQFSMQRPRSKDLSGSEVIDLRHFLTRAGWSPDAPAAPSADAAPAAPRLMVVIDHAGAKIYRIDASAGDERGHATHELQHLVHHIERAKHDEDRDEIFPDDKLFFEAVATAMKTGGEIVVISHGKGQSNEADHLSAYLQAHHKETHARIVREIVADLPHLTTRELLDLGRHAFAET